MSDFKFGVNIDANAVISQNEREMVTPKTRVEFNVKNYLNARLTNGETSKKLKIRLLPFDANGGSPFEKIYLHQLKISNGGVSQWKTFICPKHNHKGDRCPLCETSEQARKLRLSTDNEMEKKKYGDLEFEYRVREAWIVRCIDREREEDGVKFWLFNASRKKDGVYDKIINLFNERWSEAKEAGEEYSIFDLNNGKDLVLSIKKDSNNKTIIQITDASKPTPLTTNYEQGKAWIEDSKKWTDVYSVKPYDYLSIIVQGGIPVFDRELNKYVDKNEKDSLDKAREEKEKLENLTEQKTDFTKFVQNTIAAPNNDVTAKTDSKSAAPTTKPVDTITNENISKSFVDEDDLPF